MNDEQRSKMIERTERYYERQAERGMVRVKLWVPAEHRQALADMAEKLRKESAAT